MENLLLKARQAGIRMRAEGDELKISAPQGALTAELREGLQTHKSAILAYLKSGYSSATDRQFPAIEPDLAGKYEPFPLTDIQHAYWLGRNQTAEYGNVSTHFYFELQAERLDLRRWNDAFCRLIDRHDMLRAVIDQNGMQRILREVPYYEIKMQDLREANEEQQALAIEQVRKAMSHQVIPADRWPLFEVRASLLPHEQVRIHVSLDFLIMDGWSMFMLFKEWHQLYEQPVNSLPEIQLSYRDYVRGEREMADSDAHRQASEYWMERIDALPGPPELPVRQAVSVQEQSAFRRRRLTLDRATWSQLKAKAGEEGLTPSSLLLTVYADVLAQWSRTKHFTINMTLFNRLPLHPDVFRLVGDFTSLILLEIDYRPETQSFLDRARQIQKQFLADLDHREWSGVEVLREWNRRYGEAMKATMPYVFTSGLVFSENGDDAGCLERFGPMVYGVSQTPQVWLDHQVMEVNGDLVVNWDAVEAVFEAGMLDHMLESFREQLLRLADQPESWNSRSLPELPPVLQTRRKDVNDTKTVYKARLLHSGFLEHAARQPEAKAILSPSRTITYGDLYADSARVAHWLQEQGIRPGEPVAVMMHKGWEQVTAVLGILMAGAAYMPVDIQLPDKRRQDLLRIGEVRHILTQPVYEDEVGQGDNPRHMLAISEETLSGLPMPAKIEANAHLDSLAYVIFTSGTTGVPKGVMISHRGAQNTNFHINQLFGVSAGDRVLAVSSLSFDLSVYDIFGLLEAGGTMVMPDYAKGQDPNHWKQLIREHGVTLWNSAPQLMRMVMDSYLPGESEMESLRTVLLSGDWIPPDLPDRIRMKCAAAQVVSLGGATEASIWSIYHPVAFDNASNAPIPYGKPLPNQTMWVLDEAFRPCPDYVTGRIYIGGIGLAMGYWKDAEKTAARFVTDPSTGERLYDTGDLGYYTPDGNIMFVGRDDTQVKIRGHRVELGEIAAVLRQHPEIQEAVVQPVGDKPENRQLAAYLSVHGDRLATLGHSTSVDNPGASDGSQPLRALLDQAAGKTEAKQLNDGFIQAWSLLDTYYVAAMVRALRLLGATGAPGELLSVERMKAAGVADRYERWLLRAWNVLIEEGVAKSAGKGRIELTSALPSYDFDSLSSQVSMQLEQEIGFTKEDAEWFTGTIRQLPDVLTESVHSAEIYTSDATARVYQAFFPDSHALLHTTLDQWIGELESRQGGKPVRLLEVGAGLGSATQHILPVLQSIPHHYVFTDISDYFLQRAAQLFQSYSGSMSFQQFNLDIRPDFQGLERHSFDCIIASSMLHDVEDIGLALDHLISLLRPGGKLLLIEETRFFRSFDLHMGLQQGFDGYRDVHLRQEHCLLAPEQWEQVLRDAGFADVAVTRSPGSVFDYCGFHVIAAEGPATVHELDMQAVKQYLESRLPAYMVPQHMIQIDRVPVTTNGKIDYKRLPSVPEQVETSVRDRQTILAPRNPIEQRLHEAWTTVMNGREISVTDRFFDLGGDSLQATQLLREINLALPAAIEMHEFFENQTIESLARLVDSRLQAASSADQTGSRVSGQSLPTQLRYKKHEIPLSDLQLGFFMADDPYMEFHVRPHLYSERDVPELDAARYEAAWNRALERHADEIAVVRQDGTMLAVRNPEPVRCSVYDWRQQRTEDAHASMLQVRAEMERAELPLDRWPWIDIRLSYWIEDGESRTRIHYNHNNFFWDGQSIYTLFHEVDRFYEDPSLVLDPPELSLRDAAIMMAELEQSEQGQAARSYWEARLPHLPGPPELPVRAGMDRRCRSMLHRRETVVSARHWQAFKERAASNGITTSNAMIAAYAEVLSAWSNKRHFVIGHMMSRRMPIHPDMMNILGNFSSVYPLEIDFRAKDTFAARAKRVQDQILQDARHIQWGGMQILQAFNRQSEGFGKAPIPFVVGSGLFMEGFKRPDYSCLETSQVMLDHQFWELHDGALFYVLDVMESFFPAELIDDMNAAYQQLIERLAVEPALWEAEVLPLIPEHHLAARLSADQSADAVKSEEASAVRLEQFLAQAPPDRPALLTASGPLAYRELQQSS
ncbi:non-ribosomal peptide synthetase, partial [Xylanibacillus composti]